jgi:hypothetical protein
MLEVSTGQPKRRSGIGSQHLNGRTIAVGVVAVVLLVVGVVIFDSDPDSLRRQLSGLFLQLGLIGVLGALLAALVKSEFD